MNPHLNYGQAIPGIVSGRGTGLIDTRMMWMVIDTLGLISPAKLLDTEDTAVLQQWFRDFNHWMFHSEVGHSEYVWHNNHGTWYDVQRAANAMFYGDRGLVTTIIRQGITQRLAAQIAQDGKQWMELERTVPFHYSLFNMEAHLLLCRYGEHIEIDRWEWVQDGRNVQQGLIICCRLLLNRNCGLTVTCAVLIMTAHCGCSCRRHGATPGCQTLSSRLSHFPGRDSDIP